MKLTEAICSILLTQLEIRETSRNQGPGIKKFWDATNYAEGYANREPWCAAFACWIVQQAMASAGGTYTFKRPTTAAAYGFENWSLAQDLSTWTKKPPYNDIQAGDIVIFNFSHIGFAVGSPNSAGFVRTIEGNTDDAGSRDGGGVYQKTRALSLVRSRIRFRV